MISGVRAKQKVKGAFEDICMVDTPVDFHLTMNDTTGDIAHLDFPDKAYTAALKVCTCWILQISDRPLQI